MLAEENVRFGVLLDAHRYGGQADADVLARTVEVARTAERAGFDDIWITEHHFVESTVSPSALALAAFLLGVTSRVHVGTAVTLLPMHSPVHVAEQAALLDHVSDGRFVLGVGRGQPLVEYDVIGEGMSHWRAGLSEALDLTLRAFHGEVHSDSGLYHFPSVTTVPIPRTLGGPPMYIAASSPSSVGIAAERGLPMLLYFDKDPAVKAEMVAEHARLAAEAGHATRGYPHAFTVYAHATDDPDLARNLILERARKIVSLQPDVPDPQELTTMIAEHLLASHPVGNQSVCVDNLVHNISNSGCRRVLCQVETIGDTDAILANVERLASEAS